MPESMVVGERERGSSVLTVRVGGRQHGGLMERLTVIVEKGRSGLRVNGDVE